MVKAKKPDVITEIHKMRKEGVMFFTTPELMDRLGYSRTRSRHIRRILTELENEGMLEVKQVGAGTVNMYMIIDNFRVNVPFFEKPLTPNEVQSFFDRFYNDISQMIQNKVDTPQFSLCFNGNSICVKKIELRRL